MFKKLSSVLLVGALLTGCAGSAEQSASEVFVDDIQTSFTVELTETPTITEEEKVIALELIDHVNQSEYVLSDRDHIKNASANYPNHTYEELYDIYDRYFWNSHYRDSGEYHVPASAMFDVYDEVIKSNIVAGVITGSVGTLEHREIGNELRITGGYVPIRNPTEITMRLEIDDKTSEATLVYLEVDGEEAVIE